MKFPVSRIAFLAGSLALVTACAVGPDYVPPKANVPTAYKELPDGWKLATPQDAINRGSWWKIYNDPMLDMLEVQIDISNQNLKAAEAAYRAARATVSETKASLFPSLQLDGSITSADSGQPHSKSHTTYDAGVSGNWVPDVWGRIRRTLESDTANAEASAADLAAARLSAQADLATNYFNLRTQDDLKRLLDETVDGYTRSLKIAEDQYNVGVAAKADVVTAQTQLESTKALAISVGIRRAQYEHAIATLLGRTSDNFALEPKPLTTEGVPAIPTDVPSTLLERRPDIASAERQMAAANALIGVEVSGFFPNLTLSASLGMTSTALSKLFQASNSFWSFGPALAETVFDAGARSARVERATANYDQSVAFYRQTVLTSFQQVEDQLAALRILTEQAEAEASVVKLAHEAERLVLNQYKAGIVPFSSVVTAQAATFNSEQNALAVRQSRLTASVALIQALGGGWNRGQLTTSTPGK